MLLATEVNKLYRRSGACMLIQKPNNVFNQNKPHSALHEYRQVCSRVSNLFGVCTYSCCDTFSSYRHVVAHLATPTVVDQ